MSQYDICRVRAEQEQQAFLALPESLYPDDRRPHNREEERQLLTGTHALSEGFSLYPLLVFAAERAESSATGDTARRAVARCALTVYPGDQTGYLGYFESIDSLDCAKALFLEVRKLAAECGCQRLMGPVNASFWIGYRMKVNRFDCPPYFSEPYNLPYYRQLWEANGLRATDRYVSNIYTKIPFFAYHDAKYEQRKQQFAEKGYQIVTPRPQDWDSLIHEVCRMITELYQDFPAFKMLSEAEFIRHYAGLKYILGYKMSRIAYYEGRAVGFFISVPDYGVMLSRPLNRWTMFKVLLKRVRTAHYVMLYMGVEPEHRGLGKALAQVIIDQARILRADAIGAFIHEGKETETYAPDIMDGKYEYLLFGCELAKTERLAEGGRLMEAERTTEMSRLEEK